MTAPSSREPAIRVFLSYAHADDLVLEFIESFSTSLKHMAFADQGRELDIFIDRETIGWGQDWQSSIRDGINNATVFLPIITRQYFDRPACREELLTFHGEAKALGVTSLLLPVVLLGHSYVTGDSQDVAARIISERQYRDLKEAWIAGPRSDIWRSAIVQLSAELVAAAAMAEKSLFDTASVATSSESLADDEMPGAAEVNEALEVFGEESKRSIEAVAAVLTRLPSILSNPERLKAMSPAEVRSELLEVAARLRPLGLEFQERGREFESLAVRTDEIMRRYVRYLRENHLDDFLDNERKSLVGLEEAFAPMVEAEGFLNNFLEQIRPLEVSSAPMRNTMRGFREGGKAITGGIAVLRSWPNIIDEV